MADEPKQDPPAPPAADGAPLADRVGQLEAGQQTIIDKLNQLTGGGGADGGAPKAPDGGVAAEIAAQLQQRDRERQEADARKNSEDRVGALEQTVKDLAEKAPRPLESKVSKFMGWSRE